MVAPLASSSSSSFLHPGSPHRHTIHHPREDTKIRVSPAMTIVIICLMTTFLIMACVSVYIRHCVQHRMAHNFTLESDGVGASRRSRRRASSRGLDPALIDSFPIFFYSEVSGLKIGKCGLECAVCLNEFEHDETLRLLPSCSHVFHPECIDAWLSSHITCPVCRANLVPKPDETRGFVLSHDTGRESPHIHDDNLDGIDDNFIVSVHSPEVINPIEMPSRNCSTRSTPRKERVEGKLLRSYSTGDWLVRPGEDFERFTLRLPEEVKNRLVSSSLSRTKSCLAFPRASSGRKGYRTSSGGTVGEGTFFSSGSTEMGDEPMGLAVTRRFFLGPIRPDRPRRLEVVVAAAKSRTRYQRLCSSRNVAVTSVAWRNGE
ncbi:E3 ubiquitin-protein ligase ATL15-like [Camellia sinensis]|uniref:E3 ubiquitin-protein ligase ATL15-like n=1 Tax=Camellia sinensis TaxID=4442 RepID=UPI001035F59E|nr:E3 ubiquitin-protein ligase ATL15-like [Camellia sinensis]